MLISSEQNYPHQIELCLFPAHLNEGDQVCECYSYLKMVIQAHSHVDFFTIFFIKRASL